MKLELAIRVYRACNADGSCDAETVARWLGITPRHVRRILRELHEAGAFESEAQIAHREHLLAQVRGAA